jgi:hypothetical protein
MVKKFVFSIAHEAMEMSGEWGYTSTDFYGRRCLEVVVSFMSRPFYPRRKSRSTYPVIDNMDLRTGVEAEFPEDSGIKPLRNTGKVIAHYTA